MKKLILALCAACAISSAASASQIASPGAAVGGSVSGMAQMIDHCKRRAQVRVTTRHLLTNLSKGRALIEPEQPE